MKKILGIVLFGYIAVSANSMPKYYQIEKGSIYYNISSTDNQDNNASTLIKKKHLLFNEYGNQRMIEIDGTTENLEQLEYINGAILYHVNFKKKQIIRSIKPDMITKGLMGLLNDDSIYQIYSKKKGTSIVLGYACNVVERDGSLLYLYKGIPLKIESNNMGHQRIEIATAIDFDRTVRQTDFILPEYPIINQKGHTLTLGTAELNEEDKKITQKYIEEVKKEILSINSMYKVAKKIGIKNKDKSKLKINKETVLERNVQSLVKEQYTQQKENLLELKQCFEDAKALSHAQKCANGTGVNEEPLLEWNNNERQKVLVHIDKLIKANNCALSVSTTEAREKCFEKVFLEF